MFKWLKNFDKVSDEPEVVKEPTTVFSLEDQKKQELVDKLVDGLRNGPKIKTEYPTPLIPRTKTVVHNWVHNGVEIELSKTTFYSYYENYIVDLTLKVGGEPEISLEKDNKLFAAVREIKDREYNLMQENEAIRRAQVLDEKIALLDGVNNE